MNEDNRKEIRISVRNLVEFVLRSGDIDNRRSASAQKDAMLAGGRIHRKIQKRMGSGYRAEVPLNHEVRDDIVFPVTVRGTVVARCRALVVPGRHRRGLAPAAFVFFHLAFLLIRPAQRRPGSARRSRLRRCRRRSPALRSCRSSPPCP